MLSTPVSSNLCVLVLSRNNNIFLTCHLMSMFHRFGAFGCTAWSFATASETDFLETLESICMGLSEI
jgi:hypothetical protein